MTPDNSTTPDLDRLWNSEDVMAYLQFKRTTLWTLIKKKGLPAFKIPGLGEWRFRKADIDNWINGQGSDSKPS